ncbi:hypothetical protein Lqui_2952 [Legionella quinlivanii]|uniref:Uncharacterized protein n=1 Tax=Legionella quinlivanii TaxID=45073 RepID=A0A0W0XLF4_9GAMM|nr:hypothetical protein [Legionella quinlivanii]KTD45481.1 hypothetical protein Lqui_2952 [Legionella quinlivanii]SEG45956.1 hypothetical protein SAMN02746093_03029 [Legionella quinlivanii DSM 21216]STY11574.1 Uncharacterised protein [Legionella quinlivanii]
MHLVIYFCGTGNPGTDFLKGYDYVNDPNVKTIFVKGCHDREVCNGGTFPDLKGFTERFTKEVFEMREGKLYLSTSDLASKKVGISNPHSTVAAGDEQKEITSVTFAGFSRGGVTAFLEAQQFKTFAPNVEVDVVADQPVPGNSYQIPGSNAANIADCSDCSNIKNATIILGAYTGVRQWVDLNVLSKVPENYQAYKNQYVVIGRVIYYVDENAEITNAMPEGYQLHVALARTQTLRSDELASLIKPEHLHTEAFYENNSNIHRAFFSQIVPSLPHTAKRELIIIPRESHHQVRLNAADGEGHLNMAIAKSLEKRGYVSKEEVARKRQEAQKTYAVNETLPPAQFPPAQQLQSFFGLRARDAYRYVDKLHPQAGIRSGYGLLKDESIIDWWNRQDKKASRFSTELTKGLATLIHVTDYHDTDSVKRLFELTDKWLILKANSASSRYAQVESLRHHLQVKLLNMNVDKTELAQINRENLRNTNYFVNEWKKSISPASYFRTDATRILERAIQEHAMKEPNEANDRTLLEAINTWLDGKNAKTSKRYDLVIMMREQLEEVIENTYGLSQEYQSQLSH